MITLPRKLYGPLSLALAFVIFLAANIALNAGLTSARLDLTDNGRFTLSQGTRNILTKISEPIRLKFYFSRKIAADYAATQSYAERVRDLLHEYAALSHGKIILQEIDPEPYSTAEDDAAAAGLTPAPTESGESVYFGLVGRNSIDTKEVIPYFAASREAYLEYDLSSLIHKLATPKKPVVGILSGMPLEQLGNVMRQGAPMAAYAEIATNYDVQMLDTSLTSIPTSIDVLMIVNPQPLGADVMAAIDQFVLAGGRALVFIDPLSEIGINANAAQSDLPGLLQSWGISYDRNMVVADAGFAQQVQTGDARNSVAVYPAWLHVADHFNKKDTVTASLQTLNLASTGTIARADGATTTFTPLVTSSGDASLVTVDQVKGLAASPQQLLGMINPTGERFTLAARISGPARSAFGGRIASGNINVIVMADSDIFDDRFWVRMDNMYGRSALTPFADNGGFILNAIENLSGSSDLISVRTRSSGDRPFTLVRAMLAKAQGRFQNEEQVLRERMTAAEGRLKALQGQSGGSGISRAQAAEIERFRGEVATTRAALRDVQRNLRKDIVSLGNWLAAINILLMPLLVTFAGIGLYLWRRNTRRSKTS